ncbi:MAG: hypothetical protein HY741_27100 [Chloroflexi bacterium]|nr:hypothetical protein [Chloroflexota bacterium]
MEVKTTPVLEVQVKFSGAEAERLTALAAQEGVSADVLLHRAIEQFLALAAASETDRADWQALGLAAFEREWDNPEDAVYDQWREHYGVDAR